MKEWRALRAACVSYLSYMDWGSVSAELKKTEKAVIEKAAIEKALNTKR